MKTTALFLTFTTIFITSGCSLFGSKEPTEITVITKPVPLEIYQPPLPQEIKLEGIQWFVITDSNLEEKLKEIRTFQGGDLVVFAMTPQAYENMSYNLQEMRRYINQQKQIILYYRKTTADGQDLNGDGIIDRRDWEIAKKQQQEEDT